MVCLNVIVTYCQVEVSVTGRSLVQRSPTECGVSECDSDVLSDRGLCDWPITRPEESYRVWCV